MNSLEDEERVAPNIVEHVTAFGPDIEEYLIIKPSQNFNMLKQVQDVTGPVNLRQSLNYQNANLDSDLVPPRPALKGFALAPFKFDEPLDGDSYFFSKLFRGLEFNYEQIKGYQDKKEYPTLSKFLLDELSKDWRDMNINKKWEPFKGLMFSTFFDYLYGDHLRDLPLNTFIETTYLQGGEFLKNSRLRNIEFWNNPFSTELDNNLRSFIQNFYKDDFKFQPNVEDMINDPLPGSGYSIQNLATHGIVSFELYSVFLIFLHKITTLGAYIHENSMNPFDINKRWENVWDWSKRNPANYYMRWYPFFLNVMQTLSFEMYYQITRKNLKADRTKISIAGEFGGIKYMVYNDNRRGNRDSFLSDRQNESEFKKNFMEGIHKEADDKMEDQPSLEGWNENLFRLLEKYWRPLFEDLNEKELGQTVMDVIVSYYIGVGGKPGVDSNITMSVRINVERDLYGKNIDTSVFKKFFTRFLHILWLKIEDVLIKNALEYLKNKELYRDIIRHVKSYDYMSGQTKIRLNYLPLGYDSDYLWKNVRIIGWKLVSLLQRTPQIIEKIKNSLKAFHNDNKEFNSWLDVYAIDPKKNCMMQLLSYYIYKKEKQLINDDILITAYLKDNLTTECKKILNYISKGKILKLLKLLNKFLETHKFLCYIYLGNALLEKEELKHNIKAIYCVIYKNNLGIISEGRYKEMKKFRETKIYPNLDLPMYSPNLKASMKTKQFVIYPYRKEEKMEKPETDNILTIESHEMVKNQILERKSNIKSKQIQKKAKSIQTNKSKILKKKEIKELIDPIDHKNYDIFKYNNLFEAYLHEDNQNRKEMDLITEENIKMRKWLKQTKRDKNPNKFQNHNYKKKNKEKQEELNLAKLFDLEENSDKKLWDNLWGWDIETRFKKDNKTFKVWCICCYNMGDKSRNEVFWGKTCLKDFVEFIDHLILTIDQKQYFYSFNGARFDNLLVLLPFIHYFNGNISFVGNISNVKFFIIKQLIYFYDLRLILTRGKLNDLAFSILGKRKIEFDIVQYLEYEKKNEYEKKRNEIVKYCLKDCKLVGLLIKNLYGFVKELFTKQDQKELFLSKFNIFQPTIAMLTLNSWKNLGGWYNPVKGIEKTADFEKIKASYKGGVCIPLKKRYTPNANSKYLYHYDINSSYPTVMMKEIPIAIKKYEIISEYKTVSLKKSPLLQLKNNCLYEVIFRFKDKIIFPYFPIKVKEGLVYVQESLKEKQWIWGEELNYALISGHLEILEVFSFFEFFMEKIFQNYIQMLWEERKKEKDENKKMWLKIFMNSLYGKFGQKQFDKISIIHTSQLQEYILGFNKDNVLNFSPETEYLKNISLLTERKIDGGFWEMSFPPDTSLNYIGSLIHISSFIASQARIKLIDGMYSTGIDHIYYFDTDSIFTDIPMPSEYVGSDLGEWKCEENNIIDGYFLAPKVYAVKCEDGNILLHCKGIPINKLNWDDFLKMYKDKVFSYSNMTQMFHKKNVIQVENNLQKTLKLLDNKRKYDDIKNISYPFKNIKEFYDKN